MNATPSPELRPLQAVLPLAGSASAFVVLLCIGFAMGTGAMMSLVM